MKRFKNFDTFKKYIIKNSIPDFVKIEGVEYEIHYYDNIGERITFKSLSTYSPLNDDQIYYLWFDIINNNRYETKKDTIIKDYIF